MIVFLISSALGSLKAGNYSLCSQSQERVGCLDLDNSKHAQKQDYFQLIQTPKTKVPLRKWSLIASEQFFKIASQFEGQKYCLSSNDNPQIFTKVILEDCDDKSKLQLWKIQERQQNSYVIMPSLNAQLFFFMMYRGVLDSQNFFGSRWIITPY